MTNHDTESIQFGPAGSALYSPESEKAVLGCVLIDQESFEEVAAFLESGDFYIIKHQWVWSAFAHLAREGNPLDVITVSKEMERRNQLDEAGGIAYLTQLINAVPTSLHAAAYGRIVERDAVRRRILNLAGEIAKTAYDAEADLDAMRLELSRRLLDTARARDESQPISTFVNQLMVETESRMEDPREVFGIPTGFADLDRALGGLQLSEGFIISGEPGAGKSLFTGQLALQMAGYRLDPEPTPAEKHPGVIYEMEMRGVSIVRRLVATHADILSKRIRQGKIAGAELSRFVHSANLISGLPVWMSDKTHWTTVTLRADLMRRKMRDGIKWFVVDYMNLLKDRIRGEDTERIAHISTELARICRDLELAGVFIQRLTKSGMQAGKKELEHISGPASVSYDGDQVAFLSKHITSDGETPDPRIRTLAFGKMREDDAAQLFHFIFLSANGVPGFRSFRKPDSLVVALDRARAKEHQNGRVYHADLSP